jgi:hypothetical protein
MNLLVIGPRPNEAGNLEGFQRRVAAIDQALRPKFQIAYIDDAEGSVGRNRAIYAADVVYVHSVYQAQRIAKHLSAIGNRVVLDIHGAVPDEEQMAGNHMRAAETEMIEALTFRHVSTFVAVSEAMARHYQGKYPDSKNADWIVLPIFETNESYAEVNRNPRRVVYVGGAQSWQKVDDMLRAIGAANGDYEFDIVTQSPQAFDMKLTKGKHVRLRTLPSGEVPAALAASSLGFLLRDDNIVNQVACPTKLIEYLTAGVVPIVSSPAIGDALSLGYRYVALSEFIAAEPADFDLAGSREANYLVLEKMREQATTGIKQLTEICERIATHVPTVPKHKQWLNVFAQFFFDNRMRVSSYYRRFGSFIRR